MLEFIDGYPDLQETPAQFQERCGQIAPACFWKEQQGKAAGPTVPDRKPLGRAEADREPVPDGALSGWWISN
jgi:hypothetical protein